jgi:hypothetical protein
MRTFDIDLSRQTSLCMSHHVTVTGVPGVDADDAIAKAVSRAAERSLGFQGATVLDTNARLVRVDHLHAL